MGLFSSKVEYFLEEYEKQLCQLDNSLTSLASLVDSTHDSVRLLLQQLEKTEPGGGNKGISGHDSNIQLTKTLLSGIETGLYHEKMAFVLGISHFIHLLRDKSDNKQSVMKHIPTVYDLKIDKYIAKFQENEREIWNSSQLQTSAATSNGHVDPGRHKMIEEENEQLKKEQDTLRQTIEKLRREIDGYVKYSKYPKRETGNNMNVSAHIVSLKAENEQLKKDLEKALRRTETIPVHIYHQRRGELMTTIEQELLTTLNSHLDSHNKELVVSKCEKVTDIMPNRPVLVLCLSTSRLGTDVKNAIQGLLQLEHTALLIFHHKDEHALPSQSSNRVLAGSEFKQLGHISDMAFLTGKGIYKCDMNSNAVAGTIEFLCRVSEEMSRMEKQDINPSTQTLSR